MFELSKIVSVEGVGEEVLVSVVAVAITALAAFFYFSRRENNPQVLVHPDQRAAVNSARESLTDATEEAMPRRTFSAGSQCPVCLNEVSFAVETNCGHVFCARCMIAYWNHGNWLGAVRCPICRQQVTIIFQCFSESEMNSAEMEDITQRNSLQQEISNYNRRFSGESRPILDYVRDLPTLLRHLWNEFFSVGGIVFMFRIRIILCLIAALTYLISPLDIIPEAVFGILGLLDDVFVFLLLAIYVSIIYRRYIVNRGF